MNHTLTVGLVLTSVGLIGYTLGVISPYPGRALSVTGAIVGITLIAIGRWGTHGGQIV